MEDIRKLQMERNLDQEDMEGNSSYVKNICSRKGNSDQWEHGWKLHRRKGTLAKGKMEGVLKKERIPSTKQGTADHWKHKGNSLDGKETLHQKETLHSGKMEKVL
jgi:hypothetical protein